MYRVIRRGLHHLVLLRWTPVDIDVSHENSRSQAYATPSESNSPSTTIWSPPLGAGHTFPRGHAEDSQETGSPRASGTLKRDPAPPYHTIIVLRPTPGVASRSRRDRSPPSNLRAMSDHSISMPEPPDEEPNPNPDPGPDPDPSTGGNPDHGDEPNNDANDARNVSLLDRIINLIQQAGTVGEENTERDGAFSHKAETHAAGMGLAAGWYATAQGDTQLLSIVYGAAVYGRQIEASGQRRRLIKDIIEEPGYAIFFAVIGALLGSLTSGVGHGVDLVGDVGIPALPLLL